MLVGGGWVEAACPYPNPNTTLTAPVVDGCPLPAARLNAMLSPTNSFPFPTLGSTPQQKYLVNIGGYPDNERDPGGTISSFVGMMAVPGSYTQAPYPPAIYQCWVKSANPTAGNSTSCLHGFVGSAANGANPYGDTLIVSNTLYGLGNGAGHDFLYLTGSERDIGVYTKSGGGTPTGAAWGYNAITYAGVSPTGGIHGHNCRLGIPGAVPFGECLRSEDGASTTAILVGALAATANSNSQPIIVSANPVSGPAYQLVQQLMATGSAIFNNSNHAGGAFHFLVPDGGVAVVQHQGLATGVAISAENTSMSANLPLEVLATQLSLNVGSVGVGTGSATPAATLDVQGSFNVSGAATLGSGIVVGNQTVGGHVIAGGTAPSVSAGFGTGPSIVGHDSAGRVTVGTGGAASGEITFATTYSDNPPVCHAWDETTAVLLRPTTSLTKLTVTGAMVAGDVIGYMCVGV